MTKAVLVAVFALALGACGADPLPPEAWPPPVAEPVPSPPASANSSGPVPKPTFAETVARTHRGVNDAFNTHDAQKFASYLTEDASVVFAGLPAVHGRAEVAAGLKRLFDALADARTADVRTFETESVQIVEFVVQGTMTGDFMGMKATKNAVGNRSVAIAWFDDEGLVSQWHEYADLPGMLAQMRGAKDAPPVAAWPSGAPEEHAARGTSDEEKLADWFVSTNEVFNKGDPKAVAAVSAQDADATLFFFGGKALKGKDVAAFHASFGKAFPNARFDVDNAWGVDGFAIAERTVTATQKTRFGSIPASNGEVILHLVDIWRPDGDKIGRSWAYGNLAELATQAPPRGASPTKAQSNQAANK